MTSRVGPDELGCRRFCQYVEDAGLRTYDGLVIQNASDIARENDRVRNQTNWAYIQEKHQKKRRQEEAIKWISEDVVMATAGTYSGKHFRMGFMTMPASQDRLPGPCGPGFTVRSQSLHSVGGADEDPHSSSRKQPPPKPKRDPATKLSSSSETVNTTRSSSEDQCLYAEELKKLPPPKPKRNPNTQLSSSFDDSYISNHSSNASALLRAKCSSQSQSTASRDPDNEEPVYIEMVGNILRNLRSQESLEDEQSESVYEEMKFTKLEELLHDSRWDGSCQTLVLDSELTCSSCSIPPPFPNLLSHRPPLLVFPPAPAQCSPNSDESPLTPLDVTKLPMLENVGGTKTEIPQGCTNHRRDREREDTITPSGRSSAPPLTSNFYKSASSSHSGHGYPRSQSACPSPVSMNRCLTPLNLKRPPPYEALMAGGSMPCSSSLKSQDGGAKLPNSTPGSSRSRTPTSPLDELSLLLNPGRQTVKKASEAETWSGCKLGRSASTSGVSSPGGKVQRQTEPHPVLSQMPWLCGDSTMMEIIEKKRVLCGEIKARQRPDRKCKQDNMAVLGQPPSYSAHSPTALWDTAI